MNEAKHTPGQAMTGRELIAAAVRECERLGEPPTDAKLMQIIRECPDLTRFVARATGVNEWKADYVRE